jgi:hypothetical protein
LGSKNPLFIFFRGGIAVVWLGKSPNGTYVAMKQFPKQNNKQSDSSAHLELQIQQIILTHSDKQGK